MGCGPWGVYRFHKVHKLKVGNEGNTAQLCLRAAAVFLPHFFSLKNEKYIQYTFVFQTLN